ncbi:hypothetical protein TOPH_05460, partial [Tolypocladium ophioglossoides CBS 100239]
LVPAPGSCSWFLPRSPHSLHDPRIVSLQLSVKMAGRVHRITLFKVPKAEDQQKLIEQYKAVDATNQKDGKPYILSLAAGRAEDDPRSQGFTVVCKTEFASLADLKYYDDECQAHQNLKAFAKTLTVEGIQTVYFTPQVVGGAAP